MIRYGIFMVLVTASHICWTQDQCKDIVNEVVLIVAENSILKDSFDIAELHKRAMSDIEADVATDCYQVIRRLVKSIGDNHSVVQSPEQSTDWSDAAPSVGFNLISKSINSDIGYLAIPYFSSGNQIAIDSFADEVHQAIRELDNSKVRGWIVDLRYNYGGNCWPMIAGIGPLIGNGVCGFFNYSNGRIEIWKYNNGKSILGEIVHATVSNAYQQIVENTPVAVLIGSQTASSGEAVAVAFKGRKNSRFFGQPTRGLTTSNEMFVLSDGGKLFLTSAVFADRTEKQYGGHIQPDEYVESTDTRDFMKDVIIMRAVDWIYEFIQDK